MEFDFNLLHSVQCDRLNMRYESISEKEFKEIQNITMRLYHEEKIVDYKFEECYGATEYRYVIKIKTTMNSEGAIFIGWKHNSSKGSLTKTYDLKVELNPSKVFKRSKVTDQGVEHEERIADQYVYSELGYVLHRKVSRVIEMDIAIDVLKPLQEIISIPIKGRQLNLVQGTRYYGTKHKDLYLKIYDKAKERKEKAGEELGHALTRIEYSIKPGNGSGIPFYQLINYNINFDRFYTLALYNEKALSDNVKAFVLCILNGLMQFPELHHKNKKKVREAIDEQLVVISIDAITREYWEDIIAPVKEWAYDSSKDTDSDDVMERIVASNNDKWIDYLYEMKKLEKAE